MCVCGCKGGHAALNGPAPRPRTERDATSWSKSKLKEVLVGLVVEGEAGRCEISDLKQVEGEASCNSRKGKLIFFYEWNLRLSWKGTGEGVGGAAVRGPARRGRRVRRCHGRAPVRRLPPASGGSSGAGHRLHLLHRSGSGEAPPWLAEPFPAARRPVTREGGSMSPPQLSRGHVP